MGRSMEQLFTTKIEIDIDYSSVAPSGFEYESRRATAVIKYGVTLELRDWGIKGIHFFVPDQEIQITLELLKNGEEDTETFDCKVLLKDCVIEGSSIRINSDIAPSSLVLEFKTLSMAPAGKTTFSFMAEANGSLQFETDAA